MAYDGVNKRVMLYGGCAESGDCTVPLDDTWEWDGTSWTKLDVTSSPPGRFATAMAYDSARKKITLFGGCGQPTSFCGTGMSLGDTWEWDGSAWSESTLVYPNAPSQRWGHSMAFDPIKGKTMLIGGGVGQSEWDGVTWINDTPTVTPPLLIGSVIAFDAAQRAVIMFGGGTGSAGFYSPYVPSGHVSSQTWRWDGTNWNQLLPASVPSARIGATAAYDAAQARVLLVGGSDQDGVALGTTWEWDGNWTETGSNPQPSGRVFHAATFDVARGTTFIFGGADNSMMGNGALLGDTWEWDGGSWARRTSPNSPSARRDHAMTYDSARMKNVLFGGCVGSSFCPITGDTWEWSPTGWTQITSSTTPAGRAGHAMAYDVSDGRSLLFGGCVGTDETSCTLSSDTWEWDGTNWIKLNPTASPSPRWFHSLAYDPNRGRIVLFGGADGNGSLADTWEWDGTTWIPLSVASPPARAAASTTFDAAFGKIVLVGGCPTLAVNGVAGCVNEPLGDVWLWDGVTWTPSPAQAPPERYGQTLSYDSVRTQIVLVGGQSQFTHVADAFGDTWEWSGAEWKQRARTTEPASSEFEAIAYDSVRARTVLFDGASTWEWDGSEWSNRTPSLSPQTPGFIAYDAARERTVFFTSTNDPSPQTWTWDGTAWTLMSTPTSPAPRARTALVYDGRRKRVLMVGGIAVGTPGEFPQNDTWAWDGSTWTMLPPSATVTSLSRHRAAYDANRDRVVVFDGIAGGTWEFDGDGWNVSMPTVSPPVRVDYTLVYDSIRQRVRLFGGLQLVSGGEGKPLADTWEWDGTNWTQLTSPSPPTPRYASAAAFDAARAETIMFGGCDGSSSFCTTPAAKTWLFQFEAASAGESCLTGFDTRGNPEIGCVDQNCVGYCDPLCSLLDECDSDRPRCGDGTCGPLENCHLCPEDCGSCSTCGDLHCNLSESCSTCPGDCGVCP